jgi:DNA repair exonuclease SbcCD nuclease subunit
MLHHNKVALFTDLHIGIHKNSSTWHKIALNFGDWFVEVLERNKIKDIIFCGDFYHTRHEIEQTTLTCGVNFLQKLKKYNLIMIPGNHCCYFKHNSDVHSLTPFKEWSNITVYDVPTQVECFSKKIMFCPWGTTLEQMKESDYIFGHFEIANFKMNAFKVCEHGENSENLLERGTSIYTGHFHLRDCRLYDLNKTITYLGSPYEMDYGERDQAKGVTILDICTGETEFIENKLSPKHKKINLTDILQSPNLLKAITPNNFISVNVDIDVSLENIEKLHTKLTGYTPLDIKIDFHQNEPTYTVENLKETDINIETAIHEYIEALDIVETKQPVLQKVLEIFEKANKNI